MKHILFILSGNLSTTPRALKSILSLPKEYSCHIVLVNRNQNWKNKDIEIIEKHKLNVTTVNLGRSPLIPWLIATIFEKVSQKIYPLFKRKTIINAYACNKSSIFLCLALKKMNIKNYDLIIGHSSGSLYPSWHLSKKWNIPFIFDVEDYHPGEFIRKDAKNEKQRREFLMKKLLPDANALTFASPLIEEYTLNLIGEHPNHQVILNSFPQSEFNAPNSKLKTQNSSLKLIWFSQKISFGRGLEQLFEALSQLTTLHSPLTSQNLQLTLIGDLDPEFEKEVIKKHSSLTSHYSLLIKPPLSQPDLHSELAYHDIGLALEFNNTDLNRKLCLTNKIIAYAQSGLYILATDTPAQKQFMKEHKEFGVVCGQSSNEMSKSILRLIEERTKIKEGRFIRFEQGKKLAWEKEKEKLMEIWEEVLSSKS